MLSEKQQNALEALFGSPKLQSDRALKGVDRRTLDALERKGFARKDAGRRQAVWSLTPEGVAARNAI